MEVIVRGCRWRSAWPWWPPGRQPCPAASERPDRARRRRVDSLLQRRPAGRGPSFRDPQRLLGIGGLAVSGGTLALIALRPPRRVRAPSSAAAPHPGARRAVGAGISLMLVVVGLPLSRGGTRARGRLGLSTQDWGPWLADVAKSAGIGAVFAAVGGALLLALVSRFPRSWWAPAAAGPWSSAAMLCRVPVLIDPLFNQFDPLPRGSCAARCWSLRRGRGRRGRGLPGRRQPPDDRRERLRERPRPHEAGRALRQPDRRLPARRGALGGRARARPREAPRRPRGLLWLAIVAPAGMLPGPAPGGAVRTRRWPTRRTRPGPVALPAIGARARARARSPATSPATRSRGGSRRAADAFALRRRPAIRGVHRAWSAGWRSRTVATRTRRGSLQTLFGTHPTTLERIGFGVTYERGQGR